MRVLLPLLAWLVTLLACLSPGQVRADEGMWTFDNFPAAAVKRQYGADIPPAWLDHARRSTVRLSNCTGAFVSSEGLLLTNQHCIETCLAGLSSKDHSVLELGFAAPNRRAEQSCPDQRADVLIDSENVAPAIDKAVAGLADAAALAARKRTETALEEACERSSARSRSGPLHCEVVELYDGAQYFLYKYKRYEDLRVVFAPEADIAAFGGDPDNFQFPRWSLDFAILRAYEHGKPADTPEHLRIDFAGPSDGELVLVPGHPGSTARLRTRAELEFERDVVLPFTLLRTAELRGRVVQFGSVNPDNERLIRAPLSILENAIKVRRKQLDALHDDALLQDKARGEDQLRAAARLSGGDPWQEIQAAVARERTLYYEYTFFEGGAAFGSTLLHDARLLVRGADERAKPNIARLREFTDASLPEIQRELYAHVPVYAQLEVLSLSSSLERMREWLGPDQPVVHGLLAQESPDALATRLVAETKLDDAELRKQLWLGRKPAIDTSTDPMIEFARSVDGPSRSIRRRFEDEVEAPLAAASRRIAAARFAVYGTNEYPDANFTLRLNYGKVAGWQESGVAIAPYTELRQAFERATGYVPFKIPDSWMKVRAQLDMHTPFCLSTDNDIVGGNSGSPLIDAGGRLVGLVFDGNINSIAGHYRFDPANNRTIALHPAIMREALDKVYDLKWLLQELGAT
ncbi:MAG TPA: S46 family peptidase [Steroidobacteraceae bacterium]|nr:S46 family peptidase [Steroidobacteraceae bacterium]